MTGPGSAGGLLTRTHHRLRPDASRLLSRLFVPGQETLIRGESRAMAVIGRVLAMSEDEAARTLTRTLARFSGRYRDLGKTLERNFGLVAHRLGGEIEVGCARRQLIGAYFTQQYALEAAALFNPSIVQHPDQAGCAAGEVRFTSGAPGPPSTTGACSRRSLPSSAARTRTRNSSGACCRLISAWPSSTPPSANLPCSR